MTPVEHRVVRPPLVSRIVLGAVAVFGAVLLIGSVFDRGADAGTVAVGLVCALGGAVGLRARAECDPTGVVYRNLRHYRADRASITAVRVEWRGWVGAFPTLVVDRSDGRPLVLRAVGDLASQGGRARQDRRAVEWRAVLGLDERE